MLPTFHPTRLPMNFIVFVKQIQSSSLSSFLSTRASSHRSMDSTNHVRLRFMESFELYIFPRDLFIFSFKGTKKVVDGIGRHLVPSRPRIRFRTKAATSVARRASSRLGWKCRIPNGRKPADAGTHFRPDPDSLSFYRRNPWLNHSWPPLSLCLSSPSSRSIFDETSEFSEASVLLSYIPKDIYLSRFNFILTTLPQRGCTDFYLYLYLYCSVYIYIYTHFLHDDETLLV